MRALDFRDGDIVEVTPDLLHVKADSFVGVVDSRGGKDPFKYVYVRNFGRPHQRPGGWYPRQCRRVARPTHHPALPVPDNIILGEN